MGYPLPTGRARRPRIRAAADIQFIHHCAADGGNGVCRILQVLFEFLFDDFLVRLRFQLLGIFQRIEFNNIGRFNGGTSFAGKDINDLFFLQPLIKGNASGDYVNERL